MDIEIFHKFFYLGEIKVGPTILSIHSDGDWLGTCYIHPTKKNILVNEDQFVIGIREFNNTITEDLYNSLKYISIKKSEFDKFINEKFLIEWEQLEDPTKPDVYRLKNRWYE